MTSQPIAPEVVALADDALEVLFDAFPLDATLVGIRDRDALLPDPGEAAEREYVARFRGIAAAAGKLVGAGAVGADALTLELTGAFCAGHADRLDARKLEWQITDLFVAPASGLLFVVPMITLADPGQAAAYADRLAAMGGYLAGVADRHRAGVAAGRVPVARLVAAAGAQIDDYLAAPDRDPLARPAADRPDQERAAVEAALAGVVRPALRAYREVLGAEIAPHGRDDEHPGLCWLPGGEETYRALVRAETTTARTPQELHETGLAVLARLAGEYAELGGRVFGERDPVAVRQRLRTDPALRCESAEQMLALVSAAIERAEAAAPGWFGTVPAQRCEVRAVPADEQDRAPMAYYLSAPLDGSRPGIYFQNTRDPGAQPRHPLEATAFHEAVPGHHFQSTRAAAQADGPMLRRIAVLSGYDEGWALYCERLADEMGLYSSDLARFGMLDGDAIRATRLVVDTGLHALGWSRSRAVEFMLANTAAGPAEVEVEIDRYTAEPAQALSYLVGRLEFERLRADAAARLGAAFDLPAFHDLVLGTGALPLDALSRRVRAWAGGG
jgi:uncharacterized protein (DUF885 family)